MSGGIAIIPEICNGTSEGVDLTMATVGVTIAGPSSADTYNTTWTTIVASTPFDVSFIDACLIGGGKDYQFAHRIGVGASGSEKIIAEDMVCYNTGASMQHFPVPCNIPKGTRIAGTIASPATSDDGYASLTLYSAAIIATEGYAGVDSIGFKLASACGGSTIDPGATKYTKGTWVELSAATPRDYVGFYFTTDMQNTDNRDNANLNIDFGIGPSGSQQIILPNVAWRIISDDTPFGAPSTIYWIPIPAGSAVWARAASSVSTATVRLFGLTAYGIYK